MAINILVVDEDGIILSKHGDIEAEDFWAMEKIALKKNMKMVPYIDVSGDTIFNEKQVPVLAEEINELRTYPQINQKVLDNIELAIQEARTTGCLYIKFWGD